MVRKLKDSRGETVVEVLASVLIAALSVALLFSAVMASSSMDRSAQKTDAEFYAGLNNAQTHNGTPVTGKKVTVNGNGKDKEIPVSFYGGGGVLSYAPDP